MDTLWRKQLKVYVMATRLTWLDTKGQAFGETASVGTCDIEQHASNHTKNDEMDVHRFFNDRFSNDKLIHFNLHKLSCRLGKLYEWFAVDVQPNDAQWSSTRSYWNSRRTFSESLRHSFLLSLDTTLIYAR